MIKKFDGWQRIGLALLAAGYFFFVKIAWDEADKNLSVRIDFCTASYGFSAENSKSLNTCIDNATASTRPRYEDRRNPLTYLFLLVYAVVIVWAPYTLLVATIKWIAKGFRT